MKTVELRLISELMSNSRRSDRELAKSIGVSQPTVSRMIKRLEKDGYIKEYTMIPDFCKLGYELMALTFVKLKRTLSPKEADKARTMARERLNESSFAIIMLERGMGLEYDGVIVSFYEDYESYVRHRNTIRKFEFLDLSEIGSFLINLKDPVHYRSLTFATLAKHVLALKKMSQKAF